MGMRSYKKTHPSKKCSKNGKSMKNKKGGGFFDLFSSKKTTETAPNSTNNNEANTNTNKNTDGLVKISYNGKSINCEICGENNYKEIFVSVNRSKTFDVATTILGMGSATSTAGHPLTMYLCRNCNNCRFFYTKTSFNDYEKVITTTPI
jgi:hypothetical protein